MMRVYRLIILLFFFYAFILPSSPKTDDELTTPDSTTIDIDSTIIEDIPELPLDSLEKKDCIEKPVSFFNVDDSIRQIFLNEQFEYSDEIPRSFHRDAADLVRFDPGNFIIEYQNTPFRKTLSPLALPGGRVNVVFDNRTLNPFEHLVEPDNKIDFNDIPTAPVEKVFQTPGPLGMIFGGDNAVSSMILLPRQPERDHPISKLTVDKGSFGYAYTKALFVNQFAGGRTLRLAAGYRKADGAFAYRDDDAYHHFGDFVYPVNNRIRLNFAGRLYRRTGSYIVRPYVSGFNLDRSRRDHDYLAQIEMAHNSKMRNSLEFRHQYSESRLNRLSIPFYHNFKISDNSVTATFDRKLASAQLKAKTSVNFEKFSEGGVEKNRKRASWEVTYLRGDSTSSWLGFIKMEKVVGFTPAPSAALIYNRRGERFYFSGSVGYGTKFPKLNELYMRPRQSQIIVAAGPDYYESGNPALATEKQLVGNFSVGLGKIGSDFLLSATGGKIFDGIDWLRQNNLGMSLGEFVAGNNDIEFASFTARQRFTWRDKLYLSGGGSYFYMMVDNNKILPYSPDYRFFANMELHHYIERFNIHFYGYAEASYTDPYFGFHGEELGNKVMLNGHWSFRIKRFRFYFIYQNIPAYVFQAYEEYSIPGRYLYYAITWEFLE